MFPLHAEMFAFQAEHVELSKSQSKALKDHRDAHRRRLVDGLERLGHPKRHDFVPQGSVEMDTVVQHPDNDYDLDDGVSFLKSALKKKDGSDMTPAEARAMVCEAIGDPKFKKQPEVRESCVRVYYDAGYHIDVPVYRIVDPSKPKELELAKGDTWTKAAPIEVTKWLEDTNELKSPNLKNGGQFRRVVRLIKGFTRSRKTWCLPSGIAMSKLTEERFSGNDAHDDEVFAKLIDSLHQRLQSDLTVRHPVLPEYITKTANDQKMVDLRTRIAEAKEDLKILYDPTCTRLQALEAWNKVFRHGYWQRLVDEERERTKESKARAAVASGILANNRQPAAEVRKGGGQHGYGYPSG